MIKKIDFEFDFNREIQKLCCTPYARHPHGCPNYNKKEGCPPNIGLIDEIIDLEKEAYVIYTAFKIGEFAERMLKRHPEWTFAQAYNPRLWQPTARKELREETNRFNLLHPGFYVEESPEARGVNLTDLMRNFGIELRWLWPPDHSTDNLTYRISIAGHQI